MARVELPQSPMRLRKRRRRLFVAAAGVLACAAVLGGAAYLANASFLEITDIAVEGAKSVEQSDIKARVTAALEGRYMGLFAKDNIFLYPQTQIRHGLEEKYPTLRTVDVHAKDFHTIEVKVVEREPVALWCPQGQVLPGVRCKFIDEEAVAYASAFGDEPYITYYGPLSSSTPPLYLDKARFQSLSAFVAALSQKVPQDHVRAVAVEGNGDTRVYFQNDFVLIFSLRDDGGDVFERLSLALGAEPFVSHQLSDFEYLDLRFGDKLYYKLK